MSDDDVTAIVCAPWSEDQLMAIPGNRTAACARCHQPVVISRQGRELLAAEGGVVICLRCARREAPDAVPLAVPGAIEAARAAGARANFSEGLLGRPLRDTLDEDGEFR